MGFSFPGLTGKVNDRAMDMKNGPFMPSIHMALESSLADIYKTELN